MSSVTLSHIVKRYDEHTAVDDVSLEIEDGEFLVLVGPSGCGKTSTLRMIAGLESITGGDIYIGDNRANDVHPSGRDVAMVFQSYALYPHMSVYRNLEYGLRRRGVSKRDARDRVNETAAFLQMSELLDRRPGQLSGGQRQRVALGRAIVRHPSVFLMDEPLSNLDAKLRVQMRTELLRLHAKLGVTTVYVTHDQIEAMTMGHRIAVMSTGRVQQVGTPLELYTRPANQFVATFLGTPEMNLLEGEVRSADGEYLFVAPGATAPLPLARIAEGTERVTLGVRPQHLRGIPAPGASTGAPVADSGDRVPLGSGDIEFVEHLGPESFASVVSGEASLLVSVEPGREYLPGSTLSLDARVEDLHLFDAVDGTRLEVESKLQTAT